ncbi:hypothetical protein GIB67_030204 [Kingdonia uniflora]|uniref:glutathione gamma-glutamylcysteinyltransferase n=1 Tax=Kingdonia uniflora TaxID=39325 RepID=A0A7J7MMV8_9MAGN|nr:hypothetical protein GIB67_030204 [Kingdonia uniflora]
MAIAGLYMRVLPSPPAIEFASTEGKHLFTEALHSGTMEGFFKLISYFQTQSEPAFCGLASLSMALNALAIDPRRKWKGPWRWFDESMLDCCEPLEKVKAEGITFGKVACLAHCAGANVETFRTNQSSIHDFRKHIMTCAASQDCHLITSYHRGLFKQSCKHESWVSTAKYLMDDVPILLKSEDVKDVQNVLSVLFESPPAKFGEFIKWVAEVRRQEDGDISLSKEEKGRLTTKEEVLKQVRETELFKHVTEWISSRSSCCRLIPSLGVKDTLPEIAANVCCQGAELLKGTPGSSSYGFCCSATCVKCSKANGDMPVTVVSGTVVSGNGKQRVDMLVPLSPPRSCSSGSNNYNGMYPENNDVLTALLLALPLQTWAGIKKVKLLQEISGLVEIENVPSLLQEEVQHLRRQLHFLKRCQDKKVDDDLDCLHSPNSYL